VKPDPKALATLESVGHSEMESIHTRLGRVCRAKEEGKWFQKAWRRIEFDRVFGAAAVLFLSTTVAGALALIPLVDAKDSSGEPTLSDRAVTEYVVALIVLGVVGILCAAARMAIKAEREDSVRNIYTDFGRILERYEEGLKSIGQGSE
jgi:hypothetical protein